jgi:alpha 1,6-mannosyltransferase
MSLMPRQQWTIAARPYHPIFLNVIHRALNLSEGHRLGLTEEMPVLDLTGPGAFTDAVFNYLLVRWGVEPEQVAGITEPTRFGDVLVYPAQSFSVCLPSCLC